MRTKMPGIGKAAVLMERCYSVHIHSLWDRAKRVGRWSSLIAATRWHKQAPTREGSFDWLRPRLRSCVFARGQRCISALPSACGYPYPGRAAGDDCHFSLQFTQWLRNLVQRRHKKQSVRYEGTTLADASCILASILHPHQHASERPVLDQVANRVRRIGERKHFGDGWLDRTFGQTADECLLGCGQRLRRKAPKSEATYLGRLPDDVGKVDARATYTGSKHALPG